MVLQLNDDLYQLEELTAEHYNDPAFLEYLAEDGYDIESLQQMSPEMQELFFKKIGKAFKSVGKKIGSGVKKAATTVGKGVVKAGKTVGKGTVIAGKAIAKVAPKVGKIALKVGDTYLDVMAKAAEIAAPIAGMIPGYGPML